MFENKSSFKVINDEGKEVTCDILFTFDSEETQKSYIVYTDNTRDEDGNICVFASVYNSDEDETRLHPIESEKEYKIIEIILEEIQEEIREKSERPE